MTRTTIEEISAGQRILSASAGSLINSLIATPLDVVRVRVQLQQGTSNSIPGVIRSTNDAVTSPGVNSPESKGAGVLRALQHRDVRLNVYPAASLPPHAATVDLGVSACCRDVFSMPSSVSYCVVSHFDECAVHESYRSTQYSSTWDGLKKIARYEGASALFRGMSPTLFMAIPSNVIYFVGYDYLRQRVPFDSDFFAPLICGGFARTLSSTAISPVELFRTRLQSLSSGASSMKMNSKEAFATTLQGIKIMVQQQGPLSMWRGLAFTLWRDVPFSAIYWTGYEQCRKMIGSLNQDRPRPSRIATFAQAFVTGAAAGSLAALLTTPFDVGKTRRQVLQNKNPAKDNMFALLTDIVNNEGLSALFKGLVPRMFKVAISCAIMISFYEVGKTISTRSDRDEVLLAIEGE
ncbi:mitochondrial carrier domain-containing protein [Dipodascopsis tothii]|uniref:mitochondrial carrier domain-containing protein n=1 Tax=Dipodascopsis tothii TaxID=44089 RepID=UPI0034CFF050